MENTCYTNMNYKKNRVAIITQNIFQRKEYFIIVNSSWEYIVFMHPIIKLYNKWSENW